METPGYEQQATERAHPTTSRTFSAWKRGLMCVGDRNGQVFQKDVRATDRLIPIDACWICKKIRLFRRLRLGLSEQLLEV